MADGEIGQNGTNVRVVVVVAFQCNVRESHLTLCKTDILIYFNDFPVARQCDNPRPENEGAFCVGERIRYKICNLELCTQGEPSFRAQQCSKYNNETYREKQYNWLPYFDSRK